MSGKRCKFCNCILAERHWETQICDDCISNIADPIKNYYIGLLYGISMLTILVLIIAGVMATAVTAGLTSSQISSILYAIGAVCASVSILPLVYGWLRTICHVDEDLPLTSRRSTWYLVCGIVSFFVGIALISLRGTIASTFLNDFTSTTTEQVENINIEDHDAINSNNSSAGGI